MTYNKPSPKHTPLPWIVGTKDIGSPANLLMQLRQSGAYQSFAECDCTDDDADEANAAFIVRACNSHYDLLAALEVAVGAANMDHAPDRGNPDWVQKARSVIAKAKGAS